MGNTKKKCYHTSNTLNSKTNIRQMTLSERGRLIKNKTKKKLKAYYRLMAKEDVLNKKKSVEYETIFDCKHKMTEEEREERTDAKSKEEYLEIIKYDSDQCYYDLYWLYANRNTHDDVIISEKYAKKSKKVQDEFDELMSLMSP